MDGALLQLQRLYAGMEVMKMSVNGVNDVSYYQTTAAGTTAASAAKTAQPENTAKAAKESEAAVYEKGTAESAKTTGKTNTALVEKMKADAEARTSQLRSLVEKMMLKQGKTAKTAMDYLTELSGGKLQVDSATSAQAQKDIAEDGYWGVEQTSDRLVSFAKALAGDDPSKADELMAAIEKGFKEATKSWGDKLPDICHRTLEATRKKMDAWKNGSTVE